MKRDDLATAVGHHPEGEGPAFANGANLIDRLTGTQDEGPRREADRGAPFGFRLGQDRA